MKSRKLTLVILTVATMVLFSGCWLIPSGPAEGVASNEAIYVMNGGSGTISIIDIEEDSVYNDVALTGTYPNQLYVWEEKLYCVNSGSNNISIYNTETMAAEGSIDLGVGNNPMEMVAVSEDIAYVSNLMTNRVFKINLATKTVLDSIEAGIGATGIAVADNKLYVSNTGYDALTYSYAPGTVSVIDTDEDSLIATINVGTNPQDLAVDALGKVHVLCTGNYFSEYAMVYVIDPATDTVVDTTSIGDKNSAGVLFIDQASNSGFCGSWGAGAVRYHTSTLANAQFSAKGATGITVDDDENIWMSNWGNNTVYQADVAGTLIDSIVVGTGPQSLVYVKK